MKKTKPAPSPNGHAAENLIARIITHGGYELSLGLPGWRWFQFSTDIDARNFYVSDVGELKAGECWRMAEGIESKIFE